MKALLILITLLAVVSCGKKSSGSSKGSKATDKVEVLELATTTFIEKSPNGNTLLQFLTSKEGLIDVYLNYGNGFAPLKSKINNSLYVRFNFKSYKQIEEDVIELSNVSLNQYYVVGCESCNFISARKDTKIEFDKYYYDLLNNKDTIRVKILNINSTRHYILLEVAGHTL